MVLRKMGEEPLGAQERVGCRVQGIVAEVLSTQCALREALSFVVIVLWC